MNKKCMAKVGAITIATALTISLVLLISILLVSATEEQYTLGEKVKIEVGENIGDYILSIKTPTETLLYKSNKPHFIFQPSTIGKYKIEIKHKTSSSLQEKQIFFEVISKANTQAPNLEDSTIQIPIEYVEVKQVKPINQTKPIKHQITIGLPVKWEKEIARGKNIQAKIPESSSNISIKSNDKPLDFKVKTSLVDTLSNIVSDEKQKTIAISKVSENTIMRYETPAPISKEKIISKDKKEVEISSDIHYENVLAFTNLTKEIDPTKQDLINVYWKEENKFLPFNAFDTNNNTLLDYIEWTVPHLSTQTFEIIIEITHAQHLDENKQPLEDIYETVSKKDNIWQSVPVNHYVRIVFEKLLSSANDITLYAKANNTNVTVEVYEKDSTTKIATFEEISEEGYYKIFLTNLQSLQDTFDLLVIGGTILIDLIIDPTYQDHFTGFEIGLDGWSDTGADVAISTDTSYCTDTTCSNSGSYSLEIKDNSASSYSEQTFDLTAVCGSLTCDYITLSFWAFYESNIDAGEELDVKCDGTTIWSCYPENNDDPVDDSTQCAGTGILNTWNFHTINMSNLEFGSCTIDSSVVLRFESEYSANGEESWIDGINITGYIGNIPPTPTPQINSTDGTNSPSQDLNCFDTLSDLEGDSINVSIRWYKNDILNLSTNHNNNYANATFFNTILPNTSTSEGDNWTCSMQLTDGSKTSSWVNSSIINVLDPGVPIAPIILSPTSQSYPTSSIDINITTNKATDWCAYSLDGAANISITKINDTFFSSPGTFGGGEHDIEVYCNDTFGFYNSTNTSFLVSITQYETIAEWGVVEDILAASWSTVYFQKSFQEVPVVVHQIDYGYDYDDNPCTTRVRAITTSSFQIRTDSWTETASCPSVGIDGYWLAMEKGTHNVSNAGTPLRQVEATNFTMDVSACGSGANPTDWTYEANHRQFQSSWSAQPLVLSAVQTANDVDPISQYMRGCTTTNSDTWNTTCIEIGLNGMENDGAVQPCNLHTQNEEGGYIAWEMDSSWTNSETRDNTGTSGDGVAGYSWEAYWESDNVAGSQNDPYPMSNYFITLSQTYNAGIALGSGIRVDGGNGVFPTVSYSAPSNTVYLLSDEDEFGDTEQQHTPEPYEVLFFNSSTGFLFNENTLNMLTVSSPTNETIYGSSTVPFSVTTLIDSDSCWFSLDGAANQTMTETDPKNFDYNQAGLSDTNHSVVFYCNDTYGGEYTSNNYTFSVDSTPLIITALEPESKVHNTSSLNFSVNSSKAVTWCTYSLNGATNVSMTETNSTHFTASKDYMREDSYTIDYYCGTAGATSSASTTFSIDIAATENVTRGVATLPDGSSELNISFQPQDQSKAFLKFSFRSASSGPSQIQILGELMSDKITFRRYSTSGDVYIEWTVVESPDLYIQRGNLPYASGQAADAFTINQINLSESFTTISNRLNTGTASQNVQGLWAAKLDSSTQVSASRGTTGSTGEAHWQAIEWDGARVQSGYISGSGTTSPQSLTSTINTTRSFLTFSHQIAGQTSLDESFIRGYITDSDNIGFDKTSGSATHGISWYLVENDRFTVQNGSTTLTGATAINAALNQIELNSSFAFETHDSTGGGSTFANSFVTNTIFNTTAIQFQKGTGSQTQEANWFVISLGIAPVNFMSIISPTSQTYSSTTIDFNVSLSEAGDWCAYSLDEGANQTMTSLNSTYFYYTQSGLSSTSHNVTFYCNNSLGDMYSSPLITFDIDMSAPIVTSLSPANDTTNTTNTLYFSYNVTDNSGVSSCSLIANEQIIWTDTSITMDTTQSFEPYLDNGIYTWYVNCSDGGGLTSSSEKREINVSGPDIYTWTNRFYETSTSDFTSAADISLAPTRDGTENNITITLPSSSVTTVTTAKSSYLGNGGAIIPANTIIDFSAYTTVSSNNFGYLTWKLYVENSSGDTLICQSGDDFTAGTRMSSAAATWSGACNSPAYEWVLKKSDRIKMVLNVYNSDTSSLNFTHIWDNLRLSYVNFMTFTPLGALSVDLTYPTSNVSIARETTTIATCEVSCSVGSCLNTNAYIQEYNGTDWVNVDSSGGIILNGSETNPHSLGSVSSAETTNFTLRGNAASLNDIRCMATSTYSNAAGETIREIEVQDSNMPPEIFLTSPATAYFFNTSQITLFYNASDENDNIVNTTLILDGQPNQTNSSTILNNQINNFTITLADATYNWTVNATDSNLATGIDTTIRTFTIDTGIPQITLHNPTIDENLGSVSVLFNFTVQDNMDSSLTCDLDLDGTIIEPAFPAANATYVNLTKTVGLGSHEWNITCYDDAGNTNFSETRNFTITDTPPTVIPITPNFTWFDSGTFDILYNVTDNSQIKNCSLYIDGTFNQSNQSEITLNEENEFNLVGFSDGTYNWTVACQDEADLIAYSPNQTFYVDSTSPTVALNLPANLFTSSTADVNFNFTTIDALDTQLNCSLILDGTIIESSIMANNNTLTNTLSTDLTDGAHTWNVNCTDEIGNEGTSTPRTITIEEYPTLVLDTPDNSWFTGDLDIYYTPSDNTGFSNCSLIIGGTFNRTNSSTITPDVQNTFSVDDFGDGAYNWSINCTDTYGLTTPSPTRTAYRDSAAPTINLSTPADGENVFSGNVEFNWTTIDALSQNMFCNITVDGSVAESNINATNNTLTSNTTSILPGQHFWNVTCWDIAGNTDTSLTRNFTNFEAPSVSLDSPENNTWLNYSFITLEYNIFDSDNNVANCSLYIDGTFNQTNSTQITNGEVNNFTISLPEGYHNWTVECIDQTGLTGTDQYRNINIDTSSPSITMNNPAQSEILDWNNVTFNFSGQDNLDQTLNCTLIIDTFPEVTNINAINNTDTIVYVMRSDGDYDWQLQCTDEAGNQQTSPTQNFTVDAPPRITLHDPANETMTQNANFVFNYTPEDAAGLIQCELYIDGTLNDTESTIFPNQPNTFSVNGIPEGQHNWSIDCLDADSNTGSSITRTFYRDITPPLISLTAPQNDTGLDANSNIIFQWTTTDALDPLLTCDLVVDGNIEDTSFATSGFPRSEPVSGLSLGPHLWNVTCTDTSGNGGTSETREFNYTYPDYLINQTSITISNDNPTENESITINATVYNLGGTDVSSVEIKFYNEDPEGSGAQIGTTQTISISAWGQNQTSISWDAPLGNTNIFVIADFPNTTIELNETNNKANSTISVESWHYFYGNLNPGATNYTLTDSSSYELTNWNLQNMTQANIYIADYDSNINWLSLQAIGKTTSGSDSNNDITEIDTLLNMTSFKDSHAALYLNASLEINETLDYTIFANQITSVPVTTSINSTNFKTGILWDTSDDSTTEYDTVEKEDIIYITSIQKSTMGSYEVTDYELRAPAKLREYNPTNSQTAVFYLEII